MLSEIIQIEKRYERVTMEVSIDGRLSGDGNRKQEVELVLPAIRACRTERLGMG